MNFRIGQEVIIMPSCNTAGNRPFLALKLSFLLVALIFLVGCNYLQVSDNEGESDLSAAGYLEADATKSLKEAIKADYSRITIISGGLKKIDSTGRSEIGIGKVLGAMEATTYPRTYVYKRLDKNENITVTAKRNAVGPGVLSTFERTYDVLEHLHQDVLTPYSVYLANKREMTVNQEKAVSKTVTLVEQLSRAYSILAVEEGISKEREQDQIRIINKIQNELMTIYFPVEGKTR